MAGAAVTKQQAMFQAICDLFAYDPARLTATERTRIGKVAKELVAIETDPSLLAHAARAWDRIWRHQDVPLFTEMAMVAHWSKIRPLCERAIAARERQEIRELVAEPDPADLLTPEQNTRCMKALFDRVAGEITQEQLEDVIEEVRLEREEDETRLESRVAALVGT